MRDKNFMRQLLYTAIGLSASPLAFALPSFAQQTGQPCAMCHVGGYGPQLTPFGRAFKLGGYTLAAPDTQSIPFAAMLVTSYTHTKTDQPDDAAPHAGPNNNFSLQEASLFYAGRIADHLGAFAQATYSDIDRHHSRRIDQQQSDHTGRVEHAARMALSLHGIRTRTRHRGCAIDRRRTRTSSGRA